jgi:heme A synthase
MIAGLSYLVAAIAGVTVLWGIVMAIADRPPGNWQIYWAALTELAVLVQTIVGFVAIVSGHGPDEQPTAIGYLLGIVVLMPVAILWSLSERTRYSSVVMALTGAAAAVMSFRLLELWGKFGG